MAEKLTPERRRALAEKAGVNEQSLYQSLSGKGAGFKPAECVRIERVLKKELRRWDLRPNDWHQIWPELIGIEGAPKLPTEAKGAGESKPDLAHGSASEERRTQTDRRNRPDRRQGPRRGNERGAPSASVCDKPSNRKGR